MKNETFEKQLNLLTKDFELMKVKNGELKDDLTKLKTQTSLTTENIKTEVKQLAVSKTRQSNRDRNQFSTLCIRSPLGRSEFNSVA